MSFPSMRWDPGHSLPGTSLRAAPDHVLTRLSSLGSCSQSAIKAVASSPVGWGEPPGVSVPRTWHVGHVHIRGWKEAAPW